MWEKFTDQKGVTLLELIVCMAVLLMLAGGATVIYTQTVRSNFEKKTGDKLEALENSFVLYYDLNGVYPGGITDLALYASVNNVAKDAWDKDIMYYQNIYIEGKAYPAAFVSGGGDGAVESTLSGDDLQLADTDLYSLVTPGMLNGTHRARTAGKIARANAALAAYLSINSSPDPDCETDNSTHCILVLYSEGLIEGKDCYDNWGKMLVLDRDTLSFYGAGPDGTGGTSDDVV